MFFVLSGLEDDAELATLVEKLGGRGRRKKSPNAFFVQNHFWGGKKFLGSRLAREYATERNEKRGEAGLALSSEVQKAHWRHTTVQT